MLEDASLSLSLCPYSMHLYVCGPFLQHMCEALYMREDASLSLSLCVLTLCLCMYMSSLLCEALNMLEDASLSIYASLLYASVLYIHA
jgi:hypothetical protein